MKETKNNRIEKYNCKNKRDKKKKEVFYLLDSSGDVQTSDTWGGKLARVYVGNLPHSSVHVLQVLSLHYKDRLSWVKVELRTEKHR